MQTAAAIQGRYSIAKAAKLSQLSEDAVRRLVNMGVLAGDGEDDPQLSFEDVVVLRNAGKLRRSLSARKVNRSLQELKGRNRDIPLHRLSLDVRGREVIARDNGHAWVAHTGQLIFDWSPQHGNTSEGLIQRRRDESLELFEQAMVLEEHSLEQALEMYHRVLTLSPELAEAHVNIGRILHQLGKLREAEGCYRRALRLKPDEHVAIYNLAVLFEETGRRDDARALYLKVIRLEPANADAHFNVARIFEESGDGVSAYRHLRVYKDLSDSPEHDDSA